MVPMARVSGTIRTQSKTSVINVTASARLPPNRPWTEIISGQVATTMVVAQTIAPRNGRKIQIEDPIRVTMKSTASTFRVMSRWISAIPTTSVDFFQSAAFPASQCVMLSLCHDLIEIRCAANLRSSWPHKLLQGFISRYAVNSILCASSKCSAQTEPGSVKPTTRRHPPGALLRARLGRSMPISKTGCFLPWA